MKKTLGTAVLLLALAAGTACAQDTLRPEVAAPAKAAIDLLKAGQFKESLAKLAEADAVANRTPYESFVLDQVRAAAAAGAGDVDTALRSYEAVLAANRLPVEEARRINEGLVGSYLQKKDYERLIVAARRYLKDGGTSVPVRRSLVQALYARQDWAAAAQEALALVGEDEAANKRPPEDLLRLAAASQREAKDEAGYTQTLERLLRHHPKTSYWRDRIARLVRAPGYDEVYTLDAYRLLYAAGAMEDQNDYEVLADQAQRAVLPAEVQAVLDAGIAAGKVTAAPLKAQRDRAAKDAAADAKDFDRAGPLPSTANAIVALGFAQVTAGRTDKGIALVEQGLAKGGVARPELVKLRLAWAQAQAGRKPQAQALLRELQAAGGGTLADLARLWLIQLDRPAAG